MKDRGSKDLVSQEMEAEFRKIEESIEPGILDLIEVCGNYAAAIQQAESYLGIIGPSPALPISTSSSSQ